ncbi:nucleoside triphosphate pyrophosphohydrolase family protein [soil metagenome]
MNFNDYQQQALTTALTSDDDFKDMMHWVLGLNGEAGEVAEKLKKIIRDKNGIMSDSDKQELAKELGDVLWYLAVFANDLGVSLDKVATTNLQKLADRQQRNKLGGSGDNR